MKASILLAALLACACGKDRVSVGDQANSAGLTGPGSTKSPDSALAGKRVATATFTPDGKRIMVASQDGTTRVWEVGKGTPISVAQDGSVQLWDVQTGQPGLPRYEPGTLDHMPTLGPDNFKVLQNQIDALEKRVRELEKKAKP